MCEWTRESHHPFSAGRQSLPVLFVSFQLLQPGRQKPHSPQGRADRRKAREGRGEESLNLRAFMISQWRSGMSWTSECAGHPPSLASACLFQAVCPQAVCRPCEPLAPCPSCSQVGLQTPAPSCWRRRWWPCRGDVAGDVHMHDSPLPSCLPCFFPSDTNLAVLRSKFPQSKLEDQFQHIHLRRIWSERKYCYFSPNLIMSQPHRRIVTGFITADIFESQANLFIFSKWEIG